MKRLPIELNRKIMGYLRRCDVCGKHASANICNYCDFNCYYIVKQKQLKCAAVGCLLLIIIYNISTICGVICILPMLAIIETLF
jgi:hypothetical protein